MAKADSSQLVLFGRVQKRCRKCGVVKDLSGFYRHRKRKTGVGGPCKVCRDEAQRCRFQQDPHYKKGVHLRNRYGITIDDYNALLSRQGGLCAICGRAPQTRNARSGRVCRLGVDHDHATGQVRGLLCEGCNRGLGMFKDDVKVFRAAIAYLELHQTSSGSKPM